MLLDRQECVWLKCEWNGQKSRTEQWSGLWCDWGRGVSDPKEDQRMLSFQGTNVDFSDLLF